MTKAEDFISSNILSHCKRTFGHGRWVVAGPKGPCTGSFVLQLENSLFGILIHCKCSVLTSLFHNPLWTRTRRSPSCFVSSLPRSGKRLRKSRTTAQLDVQTKRLCSAAWGEVGGSLDPKWDGLFGPNKVSCQFWYGASHSAPCYFFLC